jgi:hypothetical protein
MPPEPRWHQRFANVCQALDQLETFVQPPERKERERQGLIKAFEDCFELGWNTLRLAFRVGLIRDGEAWLAMVQDRNLTSHTSNRITAEQVGRHRPGTDIDLTLVAPQLSHADRLRLMEVLDELPEALRRHVVQGRKRLGLGGCHG